MASLRETQELLCTSHGMGFITDAEFLLLYEERKSGNLDFPYQEYGTFFFARQKWSREYSRFKGREASHNSPSRCLANSCSIYIIVMKEQYVTEPRAFVPFSSDLPTLVATRT